MNTKIFQFKGKIFLALSLSLWYLMRVANLSDADVAQLAEQLICNQQVIGSSPIIGLY